MRTNRDTERLINRLDWIIALLVIILSQLLLVAFRVLFIYDSVVR